MIFTSDFIFTLPIDKETESGSLGGFVKTILIDSSLRYYKYFFLFYDIYIYITSINNTKRVLYPLEIGDLSNTVWESGKKSQN